MAFRLAAERLGPVISRDIFGQLAEPPGTGICGGVWVGPGSPIPNMRWLGDCLADHCH